MFDLYDLWRFQKGVIFIICVMLAAIVLLITDNDCPQIAVQTPPAAMTTEIEETGTSSPTVPTSTEVPTQPAAVPSETAMPSPTAAESITTSGIRYSMVLTDNSYMNLEWQGRFSIAWQAVEDPNGPFESISDAVDNYVFTHFWFNTQDGQTLEKVCRQEGREVGKRFSKYEGVVELWSYAGVPLAYSQCALMLQDLKIPAIAGVPKDVLINLEATAGADLETRMNYVYAIQEDTGKGYFVGIWGGEKIPTLEGQTLECFEQALLLNENARLGDTYVILPFKQMYWEALRPYGQISFEVVHAQIPDLCRIGDMTEVAQPDWAKVSHYATDEIRIDIYHYGYRQADGTYHKASISLHVDEDECQLYADFGDILVEFFYETEDGEEIRHPYQLIGHGDLILLKPGYNDAEFVYVRVEENGSLTWLMPEDPVGFGGSLNIHSVSTVEAYAVGSEGGASRYRAVLENSANPYIFEGEVVIQTRSLPYETSEE